MLRFAQEHLLSEGGSIVIVDAFDKADIERVEAGFTKDTELQIQKKEVITFGVKHAMQLDKPRVERLIQKLTSNKVVTRILRNFLASGEESKMKEDLGISKDYICYVLKR
jgi:hypothetical protein